MERVAVRGGKRKRAGGDSTTSDVKEKCGTFFVSSICTMQYSSNGAALSI